ncbi:MAG: hypothetical protein WC357_02610 [Candidatus Omnitrophota bacterium]|jgi:hypothetical protein
MNRVFLIVPLVIILSGCATYFEDVKIGKNISQFYVGMSYEEVVKIIGREPNPARDTILQGTDSEGQWMTWVVGQSKLLMSNSNLTQTYHFKFRNGKLTEWWGG